MRFAALASLALLGACATAPAGPPGVGEGYEWGTLPTSPTPLPPERQMFVTPEPRPVALPARTPPAIVQSELLRMPWAEVARWALPEHAATTTRVELTRGWMPEINLGWFFERPTATQYPGVCQVRARGVNFRKHNENALTYQQHLDPPLEPYQVWDYTKYRVLGSTLDGSAATDASCAASLPYADWFEAPSGLGVFYALQHIDRAKGWPRDYRLSCTEQTFDQDTVTHGARPCDARAYLEKLTPNLIKRIDGVKCEGVLTAAPIGPCWKIVYHDPRTPGSSSEFHVLAGQGVVHMNQELLPPH